MRCKCNPSGETLQVFVKKRLKKSLHLGCYRIHCYFCLLTAMDSASEICDRPIIINNDSIN